MEKKNKRNNHMMNKGMKQKVSVLLILCLLLTGYRGLTISGKAEQSEKKESNAISVSGTEVKVQLHGEDLRKAAKEAIEKGDKVEENSLKGYSADGELQKEYEAVFSPEKEVYEIPLDSISEGLSESLSEEEAGLQIFVERDAKDLESLVRKESKESLLLYDGNSQISKLFPEGKKEEKRDKTEKTKELTEGTIASSGETEETAVASDSNIRRNTELTGSELITFLYKNKSDHKISFKLSVDGNQYPKLAVAPKTQLLKALVEKLKQEEKKAQAEVKPAEKQEEKSIEKQEEKTKEEVVKAETSEEQKEISEEAASVEEEKELSEKEKKSASEVSIVSTEGKTEETQAEEEKAEKNEEKKEENKVETAEAETKEESAEKSEEAEKDGAKLTEVKKDSTKPTEAEKEVPETEKQSGEGKEAKEKAGVTGFLGEVLEHYEEFQGELVSARFTQYSLNELGRKSQNVEIEGFATVEVFYDDEAFTDADGKVEEVVLEAKRLLKPEETEKEGEKLTEEQVEAMKEHAIYEGSDALDIRFVSKDDNTKEIEPKAPVSVRLTFDKKAVPKEATADTIAIHHLLESKESGQIELVETVLRSETEKKAEKKQETLEEDEKQEETEELPLDEDAKEENLQKEENSQKDEKITKEFNVGSFSPFIITWVDGKLYHGIRFYYVDREGREIGPARYYRLTDEGQQIRDTSKPEYPFYTSENYNNDMKPAVIDDRIKYTPDGYKLLGLYGISKTTPGALYNGIGYGIFIYKLTNQEYEWGDSSGWKKGVIFNDDCYQDFVFVYTLCQAAVNNPHPDESTVDLRNEKYITDNQDGTYELTLTGQIDRKKDTNKQPLDIVFVYDNTDIMATDFNFDGTKADTEKNYVIAAKDSKSTEVKAQIKSFMDKMSASSSLYDVHYALVTMDGSKETSYDMDYRMDYTDRHKNGFEGWLYDPYATEENGYGPKRKDWKGYYKSGTDASNQFKYFPGIVYDDYNYPNYKYAKGNINLFGEFQGWKNGKADLEAALDERKDKRKQLSTNFKIHDSAHNDTKYVRKFTAEPATILSDLASLSEERTVVKEEYVLSDETKQQYKAQIAQISGENYAAAIAIVKALLHNEGDASIKAKTETLLAGDSVRDNARKVVIFIAGGDPKYAYIQTPYKEKNEYQYDDVLRFDGDKYYKTRGWYEEGYSIGNGRAIDFAALNQARGELHQITDIDAFYSIGVGNKNNWKYLNDFAMGQWYDGNGDPAKVPKKDKDGKITYVSVEGKADLRERALVNKTLYKCFDGSDASKLNKSFDEIYKRVAVKEAKNIVIRDVLTNYVQPIMKDDSKLDVSGQLVKMIPNKNGQAVEVDKVLELNDMKKLGLNGFTIKTKEVEASDTEISGLNLNYTGKRWLLTLKTIPEDFALPPGYDIRMVAKVKPTEPAENLFKSNSGYLNEGGERTDLNAIYMEYLKKGYPETVENDGKFNSSKGKLGLFTNEYADISYKTKKPDGSEGSPQTKEYNKPIIARGSLTIEKTFKGLEGTKFLNDSTGDLTDFGKKILQQLRFEVHVQNLTKIEQNGQKGYQVQKLLPVNFKDDERWLNGQKDFKEGETFKVTGTDDLNHNVTIKIERDKDNNPQLKITVDNLNPRKEYTVYEYYSGKIVGNKPEEVLDSEKGVSYQLVLTDSAKNGNFMVSVGGRSLEPSKCKGQTEAFKITNEYIKEDKPKTITIKKVVTPSTNPQSDESFEFYLEVFKIDGSRDNKLGYNEYKLLEEQLEKANPKYIESKREFTTGMINLKEPNKNDVMAIYFDLKDGESVKVPLNSNYKFRVYEIIKAGYNEAEIKAEGGDPTDKITSQVGNDKKNKFVYIKDTRQVYDGELITFTNPKKLAPPTGLVRDITPYLLSVFGFTLMAGAYFAINQKKRREI